MTVQQLRQDGYKIRVSHYRRIQGPNKDFYYGFKSTVKPISGEVIQQKGGKTIVTVTTPDGISTFGEALCSRKDHFCYKRGCQIALGRAMAKLEVKEVVA